MKLVASVCVILAWACAISAVAAPKEISPPPEGQGMVIIELTDAQNTSLEAVTQALLAGKEGDTYRASPEKLKSKALKEWDKANRPNYGLIIGRLDKATGKYETVDGVGGYSSGQGAGLYSSLELYNDPVTRKQWYVGAVPAGEAVIYGLNVQMSWQVRFNGGTPHFTIPAGGYVFLGSIDGSLNRARVTSAITSGLMPRVLKKYDFPTALCEEVIQGYLPPQDTPASMSAAQDYLRGALGGTVNVQAAVIDTVTFDVKMNSGWVKFPTHRCVSKTPPFRIQY
jgi:hypothetical protein